MSMFQKKALIAAMIVGAAVAATSASAANPVAPNGPVYDAPNYAPAPWAGYGGPGYAPWGFGGPGGYAPWNSGYGPGYYDRYYDDGPMDWMPGPWNWFSGNRYRRGGWW